MKEKILQSKTVLHGLALPVLAFAAKATSNMTRSAVVSSSLVLMMTISSLSNVNAQSTFYPGGDWYDINGNIVQAVEGGIMQIGGLYYLWGMDRSQNNYRFRGVNLYSSPDLKTWTFVNTILSRTSHPDLDNDAVVERPKLLHNTNTGQYILWVHYEGWNAYSTAEVGYATSSTIGGNYTWQGHFRPLNNDSRDMNVFKDSDGKAYLISSVAINSEVVIMELNASYTAPVQEVFRGYNSNSNSGIGCEGHAILKSGGTYFWIQSFCSGWDTNDNRYFTATSLAGPWTSRGNIAPAGARTYQSQVTNAFAVTGTSATTYVYVGDRWSVGNYSMTRLILQPLQISGTTLSLPWYDQWSINTTTGIATGGPAINFNGEFRLVNKYSGKVMEVPGYATTDGTQIKQYTSNNGTNQRWIIQNLGRGEYRINNVNSGKVVDNPSASRTLGTNTIQYTYNGGYNQKWHIIPCADGSYRIDNVNSLGKIIEIADSSTVNGAGVVLGDFAYWPNQQWYIVPVQASVTIEENTTGFCSAEGTIDMNYTGYTGAGFVNTNNAVGAGINWRVNFATSGSKTFTFRYANGSGANRPANLLVNGVVVASNINFPATSTWTTWSTVTVNANISANTSAIVRLQATTAAGTANIDNIAITGSATAECGSSSSAARQESPGPLTEDRDRNAVAGYPNPFSEKAYIAVSLLQPADVTVDILNASGIKAKTYSFGILSAGTHELELDGRELPTGIYVYKTLINGKLTTGKLIKGE
ncbi:RICIN domain-containing protein [Ohtaekwangia koreensis]|uniref:Por secretion system C-terminal sorting domain-containing protein n=1 Tax=Ohtaekwangia koreensis TaxID=688867 RepID=A0A1T5KM31_9BACT|nr:RICIN domain-containing protein [Ohtaekwangia koreensis]SKC64812.1 Por secretion system C-terminal sorting domain-containing protein [Ohtaekwangia koreensis]